MAGITAFREAFMSVDAQNAATFEDWDARRMRYAILWSMLENTAYRSVHTWSTKLKADYGLYKHIRNIYNPTNRLAVFWQTHLLGGTLDLNAGDGRETPSAIPIVTDSQAQRTAISQVWRWSNWAMRKDIYTLWGAALGDVGLRVIDDPERQKAYLEIVNPGSIREVTLDAAGNVRGYVIEEIRDDPLGKKTAVTYTEIAERDGDDVVYTTRRDGADFAWQGDAATWREPYGFVPLVLVKHLDVGLDWGWAEIYPVYGKAREIDDQASKLNDYVRKLVDAPMLFAGVDRPKTTPRTTNTAASDEQPEPGREEIPALYGPVGADAKPLVAPMDIEAVGANIDRLLAEIERDLPELQHDIWSAGADPSGRALRTARQRVDQKVRLRRPNYDDGLRRALQMAISIAGFRNYKGFAGFDLDSFKAGNLEFSIGDRPVFQADPLDAIEESQALWGAARTATQTGVPLEVFLKRQGWSTADIAEITGSEFYANWMAGQLQLA